MPASAELESWDIDRLATQCAQETRAFFRDDASDPRYCYELFRRALTAQVQAAWSAIYTEYAPLVTGWIREHPVYVTLDEDPETFVNCAFAGVWRRLSAPDTLAGFPTLEGILAYLKACARSCVRDAYRKQQSAQRHTPTLSLDAGALHGEPGSTTAAASAQSSATGPATGDPATPGQEPLQQIIAAERRAEMDAIIRQHVHDEKERLVFMSTFEWDLKPRQIYASYAQQFADVQEVYRLKRNLLERLGRDPALQSLAGIR